MKVKEKYIKKLKENLSRNENLQPNKGKASKHKKRS